MAHRQRRKGRKKGSKFDRLARTVTREYERKGYSDERAGYIGRATAGKVARLKGDLPGGY